MTMSGGFTNFQAALYMCPTARRLQISQNPKINKVRAYRYPPHTHTHIQVGDHVDSWNVLTGGGKRRNLCQVSRSVYLPT